MWAREHLETFHVSFLYFKLQFKLVNESQE